ncbi:MAG: neuraminidase-like domain-containing protein [Bacteroidota bacterium]
MPNNLNQYTVEGTILNQDNQPIKNVLVRASYQHPNGPENPLGKPIYTDSEGRFIISYSDENFPIDERERGEAEIIIRAYSPEGKILGKSSTTGDYAQHTFIDMNIESLSFLGIEEEFTVSGNIQLQDGQVARGFIVHAFDKDLRSEELLGEGITGKNGNYTIKYSSKSIIRAERGNADLFIMVFDPNYQYLGSSDIVFNAPSNAIINFRINTEDVHPMSEFERIQLSLTPLLSDLTITDLEESEELRDVSFLSGETGYSKTQIQHFVQAHYYQVDSKIDAPFWYVVLGISFYENISFKNLKEQRQQISERLNQLDEQGIRKALRVAFSTHKIHRVPEEVMQHWLKLFGGYIAESEIVADKSFARKALEEVSITSKNKQAKFVTALNKYKTFTPELVESLKNDSFEASEINDLQTTYELSGFANNDFQLVKSIKQNFKVRNPEDIRLLAKKSEMEWTELVEVTNKSNPIQKPFDLEIPDDQEKTFTAAYAKSIHKQFCTAFPTTAFSGGLDRALAYGNASGLKNPEEVKNVIDANPDFEFLTTSIDDFAREERTLQNNEELKLEFKAVQRVFKLTSDFEATNTLMQDNLHSSHSIYRTGESEFIKIYQNKPGFTKEKARATWRKAEATHAASVSLVAELKAAENAGSIAAFKSGNSAIADFPNWNNLFKGGDMCECKHCRSVYSPAAYFADLLMFLKDRKPKGIPVKDTLFARRPDLGYSELNCENANVTLPYIDVVNEVLEAVVADGDSDVELAGFTNINSSDLDQAKSDIITALQTINFTIGENVHLARVGSTDRWVMHSDTITYLLKKKGGANYFVEILRNTKAKAEELRANPQYVNSVAYQKLSSAKYPFALPFDLFGEEVKASFDKVKIKRWELMQKFRGTAAPNNATDAEIAAVYFGIAVPDEKDIILQAAPATQFELWGESNNPTLLNTIKNVKTFLRVTGLKYNQLLTLLDLEFINPGGTIQIDHLNPTCDTDQKEINPLDVNALDRIHRFLRLWRKLGWKMWEVDLVIRHINIGNGNINEQFLINLMYLVELKTQLGKKVSIEQVCSLFGDLNTTTRFTELHEKRSNAIYQDLFLNKKLINPLDLAFEVSQVDAISNTEKIEAHKSVVQAALKLKESDLNIFINLAKASDGSSYIPNEVNGDLILSHLSFLYRHAFLAKSLKIKASDWQTFLKIYNNDIEVLTDPKTAFEFVVDIKSIQSSDFKMDELNYVLTADLTAKVAAKESVASRFLISLRNSLQEVTAEFDPTQYEFLQASPLSDTDQLVELLTSLLQKLNKDDGSINYILNVFENIATSETEVLGLPGGFEFPNAISDVIKIRYNDTTKILRFTGLMTDAERITLLTDASLAAVTGIAAYQEAIEELYQQARLALKFFEPKFSAPLSNLPQAIDFKSQLSQELAAKISYNSSELRLEFNGIMSKTEKGALDGLSADVDYLNAVTNLYTLPTTGVFDPNELWIAPADLDYTPNDFYVQHLALAINKLLTFFKEKETESTIIEQLSTQLGVSQNIIKKLVNDFQIIGPETIFDHFKNTFGTSSAVVDYAGFKDTFDTYYWLHRVSIIIDKWGLNFDDLEWLMTYHSLTQTLDLSVLPIDSTNPLASLEHFIRTEKLIQLNARYTDETIRILSIIGKLHDGDYGSVNAFATELEVLTEWNAADVENWVNNVDLNYHSDYLLAENWMRLYESMKILDQLNAGTITTISFANPLMGQTESQTLKQLLRSKYGAETWLTISTEIQDVLRERKRDALAAYILAQPKPADAPSGKWENTNDLYAYYLLDVEMSSCMLTSRLIQGSGSIQLFVQRCFMGLEPEVYVKSDGDDGDSAWRWWKWMRKYRVWEANRKVFLYPENWIEPELRKDKSTFFHDLENELLQNEVNQLNVEQAYLNYLDKLNDVARLDIAGFYHEDDADQTIVHVFGRTANADPHIYYYRQYDYRRWTPWEKVEVDIVGDYLIPMVVNKRLYIFWPEFREEPDEGANKKVNSNVPDQGDSDFDLPVTKKRLQLRLAGSEYRNKKWTPKKISKDFFESTTSYSESIVKKSYKFYPVDRGNLDGKVGIKFSGYSVANIFNSSGTVIGEKSVASLNGAFELFGCEGVPVKSLNLPGSFTPIVSPEQSNLEYLDYVERIDRLDAPENDFSLNQSVLAYGNYDKVNNQIPILLQTPNLFKSHFAWHLSYLDKLMAGLGSNISFDGFNVPVGSWLPFFYADKKKTFMAFPLLDRRDRGKEEETFMGLAGGKKYYYPDIKSTLRENLTTIEGSVRDAVDQFDFSVIPYHEKLDAANLIANTLGLDPVTSITDEDLREMYVQYIMQYFNFYFGMASTLLFNFRKYHFKNFYHPFVCDFIKKVYNPTQGIPAMMSRQTQMKNSGFSFDKRYDPTPWVYDWNKGDHYPQEIVDFSPDGSYSPYNWELFYHAPLMIANSLSNNQRFEEAMEWYHYIFNPIGVEGTLPDGSDAGSPQKYWITKPFFLTTNEDYNQQRIDTILRMIAGDTTTDNYSSQLKADLEAQVKDWRNNPFEPHRIAQYRNVAYQKTVFMKYLDNLIAWGDHLFRQDSMESINEATQLYILAAELLGPRPHTIPPQVIPPIESYNELEEDFDDFSNALIQVENYIPVLPEDGLEGEPVAPIPTLYFCIPKNEKILSYWDTIADRLYKIRNCMNIEGVVRQLSLFEPKIDPGALVKAVAGGMDISSALADLNAPLPYYRFNTLLQKANEVCNDVKALGNALLTSLEKKDAEELALLRQGHEMQLLEAIKTVRELQIDEAKQNLEGLKESKELTKIKIDYYGSKEFMNAGEIVATVLNGTSIAMHTAGTIADVLAGAMFLIPDFKIGASGFGGSPHFAAEPPTGNKIGQSVSRGANGLYNVATILDKSASLANSLASYQRRKEEWDHQKEMAEQELVQIEEQILANEIRIKIAEKELANQELQIENSKEVEDFMKSKYTNKELYQWMIGQISQVYFKSYQLAYDLAKRAERCYRFELGLKDSNFIKFGYWDSLKKGLLSGDKLQYDLRRLESSYLDQNRRELELTKHVSLALLNPEALIKLRETGKCFFTLPEEIFDLDYPGHYFRRIKSVSISLPCIAGPYTTISCSLRLLNNRIRVQTGLADGYVHNNEDGILVNDSRFVQNNIPIKAIATSNAQNDSGVFELNFKDERYLPFEGAGTISDWTIDLFNDPNDANFGKALRQFDYKTISDAIVHVRYTAREAGGLLKDGAIANLKEYYSSADNQSAMKIISLKHDFASEWHKLIYPDDEDDGNVLQFKVSQQLFQFRDKLHTLKVNSITLVARCTNNGDYTITFNPPLPEPPPADANQMLLTPTSSFGNLHAGFKNTSDDSIELDFSSEIIWNLKVESPSGNNLTENELEDMYLILGYSWEDN